MKGARTFGKTKKWGLYATKRFTLCPACKERLHIWRSIKKQLRFYPNLRALIDDVLKTLDVSYDDVTNSHNCKARIVFARHRICFLARLSGFKREDIAKLLHVHQMTVNHAIRQYSKRLNTNYIKRRTDDIERAALVGDWGRVLAKQKREIGQIATVSTRRPNFDNVLLFRGHDHDYTND